MDAIVDTSRKVKEALDVWAKSMDDDFNCLSYARSMGFANGGSVGDWEDFEHSVDKNMADNVQAIYDGLQERMQLAIDHFHLAAVWRSNRTRLEDDYGDALIQIEIGLRKRGLI